MRLALILTAALALGCDDPDVSAKALDVLEHGLVAAQLHCPMCQYELVGGGTGSSHAYEAAKLVDGSCLVLATSPVRLWERGHALAVTCDTAPAIDGVALIKAEGGQLKFLNSSGVNTESADISTCCTGFNFEAFGVE